MDETKKYGNTIIFTEPGLKELLSNIIYRIDDNTAGNQKSPVGLYTPAQYEDDTGIEYDKKTEPKESDFLSKADYINALNKYKAVNKKVIRAWRPYDSNETRIIVPVGSNIEFDDKDQENIAKKWNQNSYKASEEIVDNNGNYNDQSAGTYRISIDDSVYEIGVYGYDGTVSKTPIYIQTSNEQGINMSSPSGIEISNQSFSDEQDQVNNLKITPLQLSDEEIADGQQTIGWKITGADILEPNPDSTNTGIGTQENPYNVGYFTTIKIGTGPNESDYYEISGTGGSNDGASFITTDGPKLYLNVRAEGDGTIFANDVYTGNDTTEANKTEDQPIASIRTAGGIYAAKNIWAQRVFNAVFNDYAEYRTTCEGVKPGQCVYDNDDGSLSISDKFLIPGAQIVSDTFGHAMGMTEKCTTPIAVAGRVLAYPYQDRSKYHAGMAVCAAPGGTVNIMSRTDIVEYPDCIVGIVSEIPDYEYWGTDNVKVDGRIWIKVK